jgi:hypothetical protein
MRADNSRHLIAAAQQRAEQTRRKALAALRRLDNTGRPISFDSVAREARVSRSWLYTQADVRSEIERLRGRHQSTAKPGPPERQRASEASLLRRLQAATERVRQLERANHELRDALARALGEQRATAVTGPTRRDTPEKPSAKLLGPR